MGFLEKIIRKVSLQGNQTGEKEEVLKPFAILQDDQLFWFIHALLDGCNSLYEKAYKKTGESRFTKRYKQSQTFKKIKGLDVDTYLAALEALMLGTTGFGYDTIKGLEYGQDKFFDENGYLVRYIKEEPLYEKKNSRNAYGNYSMLAGIVQISYQSPIGSFLIKQNEINDKLFEIYASEDISETLYKRLAKALEIALEMKPQEIESKCSGKYNIQIGKNSDDVPKLTSSSNNKRRIPGSLEDIQR